MPLPWADFVFWVSSVVVPVFMFRAMLLGVQAVASEDQAKKLEAELSASSDQAKKLETELSASKHVSRQMVYLNTCRCTL